ncbi:YnfC family lipoprotein [Salmonella enterica subsp. enterica serovar Monschaui]|uniref:YnfC family lipoprotein n=1 Tax=Salmonella enterica TaxID=28901 RepID=UPI0009B06B4E|nr:YnfC family lipoprotein [Salmonella enterica]EIL1252456.1 YnfC family lipoprotein [Salmonella enterica subsp. enterica serovar Newport]EBR0224236.1 YnfC family lipoprotein [Salmonella enterica subsp. enterica serovar Monschaui]EDZ0759071.1 YnfC family lipoprotein [Salmonella enterica]EHA5317174.1 YnfC family lipoprotein [Salmonella enterica]EIL4146775.1 YnfC family lipoprotein [Salmonella enterica subsp. enterica serovar Newport]
MKKPLLLTLLCMILAGCDNPKSLESFTPEMASFSNEFDFDPLRGPVKDFSQTLMSENGEVAKQVTGTLSQEGCFDTLELHDLENNTGLALVLDANYYRDAQTLEKKVQLQGKCQLAALPSAGVTWETDDNGFVVSATGKEMKVEYRYDSEGYPLGKTTINSQNTLSVTAKPSVDPRKKLDYTAVSRVDDRQVGNVTQSCEYDAYANPVDCRLVIVDESVKPAVSHHYTIKNRIDYY